MNVLVLGASGMLGHTLLYQLIDRSEIEAFGTVQGEITRYCGHMPQKMIEKLIPNVNAYDIERLSELIVNEIDPDIVINCIGLIRQKSEGKLALPCIEINSRLPHQLKNICMKNNCKLIHVSTDCVFHGGESEYIENSYPSARDIYGLSKFLGEVKDGLNLTLRTSIIGHEIFSNYSLLEWFLKQENEVDGHDGAIYTGLPTYYLADKMIEIILKYPELKGLYQISSHPISKYSLLKMIAKEYGKNISINRIDYGKAKILSYKKLAQEIGYSPDSWKYLIKGMFNHQCRYLENCKK